MLVTTLATSEAVPLGLLAVAPGTVQLCPTSQVLAGAARDARRLYTSVDHGTWGAAVHCPLPVALLPGKAAAVHAVAVAFLACQPPRLALADVTGAVIRHVTVTFTTATCGAARGLVPVALASSCLAHRKVYECARGGVLPRWRERCRRAPHRHTCASLRCPCCGTWTSPQRSKRSLRTRVLVWCTGAWPPGLPSFAHCACTKTIGAGAPHRRAQDARALHQRARPCLVAKLALDACAGALLLLPRIFTTPEKERPSRRHQFFDTTRGRPRRKRRKMYAHVDGRQVQRLPSALGTN